MLLWLLAATSTATFGAHGFVLDRSGRYTSVHLDAEDRAVAAGFSKGAAILDRYLQDGARDPTFWRDSAVVDAPGRDRFLDVTVDGAGWILAAGQQDRRGLIARFLPDGQPDRSFGELGLVIGRDGGAFLHERGGESSDRFDSVDVDSRGRIVVAGVAAGFRPSRWSETFLCRWFDLKLCWSFEETTLVARFLADGRLDHTFAGSGYVLGRGGARWHVGPHDELLQAVVLEGDRIAAAGWASGETYDDERTIVVRYLEDGSLDPAFGSGGAVVSRPESFAGGAKEVLYGLTRDGDRLVTCGFSFDRSHHIRALLETYDAAGTLIGHALTDARQLADSDIEDYVKCAVDAKGRVVGVGFTDDDWSYGDEPDRALIGRHRADGALDGSFSSYQDGRSIFAVTKNDGFYDLALDASGRVWAVGSASGRTLIARFRDDLTLDGSR